MNTLACADPCPSLLRMKGPFGPTLPAECGETTCRASLQREPCSGSPFPTAEQEPHRRPAAPPRGQALSLHALDRSSLEQDPRGCEPGPGVGLCCPQGSPPPRSETQRATGIERVVFHLSRFWEEAAGAVGGLFQGRFPAGPPPPQILYTAVAHLRSRRGGGGDSL